MSSSVTRGPTGTLAEEDYLLRNRDAEETKRLTMQHKSVLAICENNLLHPSIDKTKVCTVADVGTGTGIWLEDLATSLLFVPLSDPLETRTYFGFDISSSQFPTVVNNNVKYKVHDVLKPFSNKHKGKFDVVHVRFLNVAVKEKDILRVTTNMMELLKPGGYLQWAETALDSHHSIPPSPRYNSIMSLWVNHAVSVGFTRNLPSQLKVVYRDLGLHDIEKKDYFPANLIGNSESKKKLAQQRVFNLVKAVLPDILRAQGLDKQGSVDKLKGVLADLKDVFANGAIPAFTFSIVLGRNSFELDHDL